MSAGVSVLTVAFLACCEQVLLAVGSGSCTESVLNEAQSPELGESLLQSRSNRELRAAEALKAKDILPPDLYELGVEVFHNEEDLQKAVEESMEMNIEYAGVPVTLRVLNKDNAAKRLGGETEDGKEYGLDTLLEARQEDHDMVNMIDMGGNYGVVTIATYNKYPGLLRTVVVEPVAATYFFLRWNMYLNKVPHLSQEDFVKDKTRPGVVALYGGVPVTADEDVVLVCVHPEWSMNAMAVAKFDAGWGCDCRFMNCTKVPRLSMDTLLDDFFQDSSITLIKMDCEGCESHVLPELKEKLSRVKRLAGELHHPEEELIDLACKYDNGRYITKVCKIKEGDKTVSKEETNDEYASAKHDVWASSLPLGCNEERQKCIW